MPSSTHVVAEPVQRVLAAFDTLLLPISTYVGQSWNNHHSFAGLNALPVFILCFILLFLSGVICVTKLSTNLFFSYSALPFLTTQIWVVTFSSCVNNKYAASMNPNQIQSCLPCDNNISKKRAYQPLPEDGAFMLEVRVDSPIKKLKASSEKIGISQPETPTITPICPYESTHFPLNGLHSAPMQQDGGYFGQTPTFTTAPADSSMTGYCEGVTHHPATHQQRCPFPADQHSQCFPGARNNYNFPPAMNHQSVLQPQIQNNMKPKSTGSAHTFKLGFKADCEKCRSRVPGHYAHF